jgi:aspartate racemase
MHERTLTQTMKRIGIIGGLGPEATVDYYQRLVARYRELRPGAGYPDMVVDSLNPDLVRGWIEQGDLGALTDYLVRSSERLAAADASIGAMTANTVHLVFTDVATRSPLPLVSIVEATRDAARERRLTRLALFGTNFTMEAPFYPDTFAAAGMSIVVPSAEERARIHRIYLDELLIGMYLDTSRAVLLTVAKRMKADEEVDGLILGGSELPLILKPEHETIAGLPFLDTTAIHVDALLVRALA